MNCSFVRNSKPDVFEERRTQERRAEEDYGAWKVVCDTWNKVALRRSKEVRRNDSGYSELTH